MPTPDPREFAEEWVRAWNAHDVEAVLAHFHDDVEFTSPVAARVLPDSDGVVRGKDALRHYWTTALTMLPDLHFEPTELDRTCWSTLSNLASNSRRASVSAVSP